MNLLRLSTSLKRLDNQAIVFPFFSPSFCLFESSKAWLSFYFHSLGRFHQALCGKRKWHIIWQKKKKMQNHQKLTRRTIFCESFAKSYSQFAKLNYQKMLLIIWTNWNVDEINRLLVKIEFDISFFFSPSFDGFILHSFSKIPRDNKTVSKGVFVACQSSVIASLILLGWSNNCSERKVGL